MKKSNKLKTVVEKNFNSSAIYLIVIAVVYLFISLINFTDFEIDATRLGDLDFWMTYILTMGLSFIVLFLIIPYTKIKLKNTSKVKDKEEEVDTIYRKCDTGKERKFLEKYVVEENAKRKYNAYRDYLISKRSRSQKLIEKCKKFLFVKVDKVKKQENIENYIKQIEEIDLKNFYKQLEDKNITEEEKEVILDKIEKAKRIIDLSNIDYQEILLSDLSNIYRPKNKKEKETSYSGREGFYNYIFPALFIGLGFTIVSMLISFMFKNEMTVDTWIQLLMRIGVMSSYLVKGIGFAKFSILEVYYGILCNRKSIMLNALQEMYPDCEIEINENKNYKYLLDIKKENKEVEDGRPNNNELNNNEIN